MHIFALILAATLATKADVPRVSPKELHELMEKGEAVAVDVRGTVPYELGHIAGAVWVPLGRISQRFGELPQNKLIVTYCTCKAEETSLEGAMILANQHGFPKVAVLRGGYPAWKEAGLPTEAIEEVPAPDIVESAPAPASASAGRLAPPDAVKCDRNQLTSYAGKVTRIVRKKGEIRLTMHTSADTVETVVVRSSSSFLIEGKAFASADWKRIPEGTSAIAWVCKNGASLVDWRPGVTFDGAE
jgi:rhodanese-related sulfurtransferase